MALGLSTGSGVKHAAESLADTASQLNSNLASVH